MTSNWKRFTVALLVPAALSLAAHDPISAPAPQEDDPVYVDEIKKDFLDRIDRCRTASDWKGLFDLQAQASLPKNIHKLVRLPGNEARYVGLIEHLNRKFADLPSEALKYYRDRFDGAARYAFERAIEDDDRAAIEKVVETWFYSRSTDEALDLLANLHVEEGRLGLAVHCWSRLLYHYPDSEMPRAVTAARLARAAALSSQESALDAVRRYAQDEELGGEVVVGDSSMSLDSYLRTLRVEPVPSLVAAVPRDPSILPPGGPDEDDRLMGVRPEIRRWQADLSGGPEAAPRRGGAPSDFPYLPAYAQIDGHEMIVYTNGIVVTVIDPARATASRPDEGIYFRYPPPGESIPRPQIPADPRGLGLSWTRPYIGATVDGDFAFATLYSAKRPREAPAPGPWGMQDTLFGMTRLVCLNLRTQQVMWDTDFGEPGVQLRKLEFWDRNFAFSGPPLVCGDRVYAGIGTSPMSEEEGRVVCFDRRTGAVLWDRFLASVSGGGGRFFPGGGGNTLMSRLTVLEEDRGVLIVHANIGILAALDAITGQVRWLSKYPRTNVGPNQWGQPQVFSRPASPIVIHRGKIYILPQDATDLQIADLATGAIQKEALKVETALATRPWRDFQRLIGRMGDFLVFGGTGIDSCILNTATGSFHGLTYTNTSGTGRGMIEGETLYLPCVDQGRGGLGIFTGQKQWWAFERSIIWWPLGEGGNIIRAGNYLVFTSTNKISLLTDSERVRREYRRRLEQSPPNPSAWLDYGMLMYANERWAEAAKGYLNFIEAVQGDAEWMGRARDERTKLHGIFLKLGHESFARKNPAEAAEHYRRARDFAWDGPTLTEATRLFAGACESAAEIQTEAAPRRQWARKAVEEYQELIRRSPPGFVKPGDAMLWVPTRRYASSRIAALVRKHGADAYDGVSRAAGEELKKAGRDPAALRAMADLYPDSVSAIEALDRIAQHAAGKGKWTSAASALREMRARLGDRWTPGGQKRLMDALEKAGDAERFEAELARMERSFEGSNKLGPEEDASTVAEYLPKARAALGGLTRRPAETPPSSTSTLSTWEPSVPAASALQLPVEWRLVVPGGHEPRGASADREFFARGSAIESWNVRTKKRAWSAPHPGGWIGLAYTHSGDPRGVLVTEAADGAPADKAGLQRGDVILSVDGAPVMEDDFDLAVEARPAGARLSIVYKRGAETRRAEVVTAAWPGDARPSIVGAAYTSEGLLAVAWEDCVAAIDPADGRVAWVSRPSRPRFLLRDLHACEDRILVHEHVFADRCRSAYRAGVRGALPPDEQHSRVIALDETDGEPVWAVGFRFDWNVAAHHSVRFLGGPLDSHAGLLVSGAVGNQRTMEVVPVAAEDGREGNRIPLSGAGGPPGAAWTVDPTTGTLWVIDSPARGQTKLRSFVRPDYARGPEMSLEAQVDPMASGFSVAANGDRVAVLSISRGPVTPKLAVFSARDGSLIAANKPGDGPLKDRVTPGFTPSQAERKSFPGLVTLEPDGTLIVYNEQKPPSGRAGTIRRASLTALTVEDGKFKLAWDALTPTLSSAAFAEREVLTVLSGPHGHFVTTPRGFPPGKTEEAAVLSFHSRKEEGAVRKLIDDLAVPLDAFNQRGDPTPTHRGRIFLNRSGGLEIWGD